MASTASWMLVLSLFIALSGAIAAWLGAWRRSPRFVANAEKAVWTVAALITLASALLFYLLVTHDFRVRYVYQYTSTRMPLVYTISALWAGQEGSLLLWFWLMAILAVLASRQKHKLGQAGPYLLMILALVEAFFAALLVTTSNPFVTLPVQPLEGTGLLPLLENPGMVIHPPILFLGYAAYTVPFAFALAVLMGNQLDSDWRKAVRLWSLLAWLALSAGILIGAWWSYLELGWGGYWAWDAVENASLIPWLLGTAFLHSLMMEERRGMHRGWNVALPTLAFAFCLFATLVTRGGMILSDLHGFSRNVQPVAYYLLAFIALVLGGSFSLIYFRRSQLTNQRQEEDLLSREASFLLSGMLFCGAALIVFLGTVFPVLTQAFSGALIQLGPSFYNRAVGPIMAVIICLMGVCPILGWQKTRGKALAILRVPLSAAFMLAAVAYLLGITEPFPLISVAICTFVVFSLLSIFIRDLTRQRLTGKNYATAIGTLLSKARRRYGAYLVHLAVILITMGITGSTAYKRELLVTLKPGDSTAFGDYKIQYEGYSVETLHAQPVTYQSKIRYSAQLGIYKAGSRVSNLVAEKNYHWAMDPPWVTEVAIYSTLKEDLYVILADLEQDGTAGFQMVINPLVNWIWIGGGVLLIGTLLAAWPQRQTTAREDYSALLPGAGLPRSQETSR